MSKTFAEKAIDYFLSLKEPENLPENISALNPYEQPHVKEIVREFFLKFFNDENPRVFIFGINPGRFGGGKTGISFTDPVALRKFLGIENSLGNKKELSSEFVYNVINLYGGAEKFYSKFFLSAVFPLAVIRDGKNYNYYDTKELFEILKPHLIESLQKQFTLGTKKRIAISLGKKNAEFLIRLNNELGLFDKIEYLDHPRFIMQYRRKKLDEYLKKYLALLRKV